MKLIVKKSALVQYMLIYLLICFQGSIGFRAYNSVFIITAMLTMIMVVLTKKNNIPSHYLLFLFMLLLLFLFEVAITDGGTQISSVVSIMSRYAIVLAAYYYDEKFFADRFVKMMIFFAVVSLIGFVIVEISPAILQTILVKRSETVTTYWKTYSVDFYGTFLFAFTNATERNIGIFHEPGLYQIVLNATLYILLFKRNMLRITNRKWTIYCAIIIVTIITSMSTTGLIGMVGLLLVYTLFARNEKTNSSKMKYVLVIGLAVFGIYCFFADADSFINKYVFSKIMSNGKLDFSSSTGSSRIMSMLSDISIFRHHILGIGYSKYKTAFRENLLDETIPDLSSCVGFTQVLAVFGIIVFLFILGYYAFLIRRNLNKEESLAFLFIFINTGLAQPYIWFPAFVVLLLLGENRTKYVYDNLDLKVIKY